MNESAEELLKDGLRALPPGPEGVTVVLSFLQDLVAKLDDFEAHTRAAFCAAIFRYSEPSVGRDDLLSVLRETLENVVTDDDEDAIMDENTTSRGGKRSRRGRPDSSLLRLAAVDGEHTTLSSALERLGHFAQEHVKQTGPGPNTRQSVRNVPCLVKLFEQMHAPSTFKRLAASVRSVLKATPALVSQQTPSLSSTAPSVFRDCVSCFRNMLNIEKNHAELGDICNLYNNMIVYLKWTELQEALRDQSHAAHSWLLEQVKAHGRAHPSSMNDLARLKAVIKVHLGFPDPSNREHHGRQAQAIQPSAENYWNTVMSIGRKVKILVAHFTEGVLALFFKTHLKAIPVTLLEKACGYIAKTRPSLRKLSEVLKHALVVPLVRRGTLCEEHWGNFLDMDWNARHPTTWTVRETIDYPAPHPDSNSDGAAADISLTAISQGPRNPSQPRGNATPSRSGVHEPLPKRPSPIYPITPSSSRHDRPRQSKVDQLGSTRPRSPTVQHVQRKRRKADSNTPGAAVSWIDRIGARSGISDRSDDGGRYNRDARSGTSDDHPDDSRRYDRAERSEHSRGRSITTPTPLAPLKQSFCQPHHQSRTHGREPSDDNGHVAVSNAGDRRSGLPVEQHVASGPEASEKDGSEMRINDSDVTSGQDTDETESD